MVQNIVTELTAELASQSAQLEALRSDAALTDAISKVRGYELPALRASHCWHCPSYSQAVALPALGCMHGAARLTHVVSVQPLAAISTAAGATTCSLHVTQGEHALFWP